ncbi:MAG: hypothetical protein FE78DRAFT_82171 [Acidomyces sp. 'richmondensis']|nr:MAG: hypothetical protein FE78DRAFT_82171 [Acidomyces sp. 'richmondensis']
MGLLLCRTDALPGIVALADLKVVLERNILTGTSFLLDMFALSLNCGEYPACAAMTTGYCFRIENRATVYFLQKIGKTGHLTTLAVSGSKKQSKRLARDISELIYVLAIAISLTMLVVLAMIHDWWCLAAVLILILPRLINVIVIRRRVSADWSGATEPEVRGDLIISLSQARWIRMKGCVDVLKAITSGQWLREPSFNESSLVGLSTFLVYFEAILAGNASERGKLLLLIALFCSYGLLGVVNRRIKVLQMKNRLIKVESQSERYMRRLDIAEQLVKDTDRDD